MKLFSLVRWSWSPDLGTILQIHAVAFMLVLLTFLLTWMATTINFHRRMSQFAARSSTATKTLQPLPPPMIPYAIPWLGHTLTFLSEEPGLFWRLLQAKLRKTGTDTRICTILLGGQKAHVLNSATAVQALFRNKNASRELFNHQLATNALGTSRADAERMWPPAAHTPIIARKTGDGKQGSMEALNHEFLLSQTAVNALANKFMECLGEAVAKAEFDHEWQSVDLLSWVKAIMFEASAKAFFGDKILEMNPNLAEQYWKYDSGFLARFYGLPKFLKPDIYAGMDDLVLRMEAWVKYNLDECDGKPPVEPEWDAKFGGKIIRARHRFYELVGLSLRGRAAFDLGFMFGHLYLGSLSGNVIPLTNWILVHLLSPQTPTDILPRVKAEVEKARKPDNGIDMAVLLSQPLLNSVCHETMRHYVDCLVTRQLDTDMVLDGCLLKKNDLVMAPTSLSQHDATFWEETGNAPSADTWQAERFMRHNSTTGSDEFTTSWATGKFFPFGGGGYICPGRVFAKQEVLIALATILLQFDIKFVEFLHTDKQGSTIGLGTASAGFPKVKRQYAGNGTLQIDGDVRVQLRRK